MKNKASRVLPNKRQTHERLPETLYYQSSKFVKDEHGRDMVECSTYRHGRPPSLTPKQRAKATKAMMEARRANPNGGGK